MCKESAALQLDAIGKDQQAVPVATPDYGPLGAIELQLIVKQPGVINLQIARFYFEPATCLVGAKTAGEITQLRLSLAERGPGVFQSGLDLELPSVARHTADVNGQVSGRTAGPELCIRFRVLRRQPGQHELEVFQVQIAGAHINTLQHTVGRLDNLGTQIRLRPAPNRRM